MLAIVTLSPAVNLSCLFNNAALTALFCIAFVEVEFKVLSIVACFDLITPLVTVIVLPSTLTPPKTVSDAVGKVYLVALPFVFIISTCVCNSVKSSALALLSSSVFTLCIH